MAHQIELAEDRWADELEFLQRWDPGARPPGWMLTPRAVVEFIMGHPELRVGETKLSISQKYVGDRALIERCVVTLAGSRGLMLVGEPGTAKSMLSELLAAATSGTSTLVVQGTAGTTEDQLRYGWNYAMLLNEGPTLDALVPSPVMTAMSNGQIARVEEVTRCLPEVQDSLVSVLSERRIAVPELENTSIAANEGFGLIATANLRDRGVSEMSAALKRRFNFETVHPIADPDAEVALVVSQTRRALEVAKVDTPVDEALVDTLVTVFRDLRSGVSREGWPVEKPTTVLSTAEAVSVSTSLALASAYFSGREGGLRDLAGHLMGVVCKDDPADADRLRGYWDAVVHRRAEDGAKTWRTLWSHRTELM